ncbi:hypothetical protein [Hyphomicrobium sp.]|uniref:hypothetical protein n=1 Tax=Hyphomicrobium sp. TaxID=82 RepID=UPI001DB37993|nr:hypothetical protein [Hyphomicrobium sp.]MBY0561459.1 hypothetical protein [Hyphomicrobium sp.]
MPRVVEAQRALNQLKSPADDGDLSSDLAIDVELPLPRSIQPESIASWVIDALTIISNSGARVVEGPAALLIELPHRIVHGTPSGVLYSVELVKALLMREKFVEGPEALADVCIRQGERPGIYVALKPFAV